MESPESEYVLGDTIELDYQCYNTIGSHDLDKGGYLDIVVTSNGNIYSSSRSDYNKDGKLDFFTSQYYGGVELFINQGSFEFTRDTYTSANYNQVREIQVAVLLAIK